METVGRNRNVEAASGEILKKEMNMLLETGGKVILVISWQKIWANCVLQLCGKQSFQAMNVDVWLRRFPSKMLKVQPCFFLTECSKMQDEGDKLRKKLFNKTEQYLMI